MKRKKTVLVVDDDVGLVETLASVFQRKDYNVVSATSGELALEIARNIEVDLVLMDLKLPGIDGVSAFQEIRKISPRAALVAMTGYSDEQLIRKSWEEGAYTVIYKPFKLDALLGALKGALERKVILIIDDTFGDTEIFREKLRKIGYSCNLARNEKELLEEIKKESLLILYNVKEFHQQKEFPLTKIREKNPDIGMIVLCGYTQDDFLDKCFKDGLWAYLHKPVEIEKIFKAVEKQT